MIGSKVPRSFPPRAPAEILHKQIRFEVPETLCFDTYGRAHASQLTSLCLQPEELVVKPKSQGLAGLKKYLAVKASLEEEGLTAAAEK